MNAKHIRSGMLALLLAGLLGTGGCSTIPARYKPCQVGPIADCEPVGGLSLTIRTDQPTARIGDLITFSVIIKNVGTKPVWLPENPSILLTWIYPDGKQDNFVADESRNAGAPKLFALAAGDERAFRTSVTTYYFDHRGITEFRARVQVPPISAPAQGLAWAGDLASNGYGVLFAN